MDYPSLEKKAWVLTFYAFKGGTGRTLALSNIARHLFEARGYRVGIIDLDLESPGLPHMPLAPGIQDPVGESIDGSLGFADLFCSALSSPSADPVDTPIVHQRIKHHVLRLPCDHATGALFLMPAAIGSATRNSAFRDRLATFLDGTKDLSLSAFVTQQIVTAFIQHFSLDFLFIDGRTGIGPFFPVYTYSIPHALVLFTGLNEQNIGGSLDVLQQRQDTPCGVTAWPEAPVFLVISPVPADGPRLLEERLRRIDARLSELARDRTSNNSTLHSYIFELPRTRYLLPYTDVASYEETYFIPTFPHSQLTQAYLRLARDIESLVSKKEPSKLLASISLNNIDLDGATALALMAKPLNVAAENISLEPLHDFLTHDIGLVKSKQLRSRDCPLIFEYTADNKPKVQLHLWSATDTNAPWERLTQTHEPSDSIQVMMVPQSSLSSILAKEYHHLLNLSSPTTLDLGIVNYSFLDTWFPGWRRWCIYNGSLRALPFSMNTTLMCSNRNLLKELFAKSPQSSKADLRLASFPSNWHSLLRLLESVRSSGSDLDFIPFAISRHGRALYYEWLNIVLAFGGLDMKFGEGNIRLDLHCPSVSAPETIEGTEFFLHLIKALASEGSIADRNTASEGVKMDSLIADFWSGKLCSYMAWTDAFRFRDAEIAPARFNNHMSVDSTSGICVQLGRFPRDIRYPRKPLVANWVALINGDKSTCKASLYLMQKFLDPETQRRLLRAGFPSASRRAIEDELERHSLRYVREGPTGENIQEKLFPQNYENFLASLLDAFDNGHLIPSFEGSVAWINLTCKILLELIGEAEKGVVSRNTITTKLKKLGERGRKILGGTDAKI
jgi:ABC-type glycerol-3-phosphate transport system substrate-binding protein